MKHILTITAAIFLCLMLAGCESRKQKMDYTEDELPYGATMREDKQSYAVPVGYDRRFINEEQIAAVANYYAAMEQNSAELYMAATLDFYAKYQQEEVYKNTYRTMDEMVGAMHQSIADRLGGDFTFDMVTVSACTQEANASGLEGMLDLLDKISGEEDFRSTVDNCWALETDWIVRAGNTSAVSENNQLYLLEIGGKYYCVA